MRQATWKRAASAVVGGVVAVACGGPVGIGSPLAAVIGDAACPELRGGAMRATYVEDARANATIRAFVTAAGDLAVVAERAEANVFGACERMASDLGVPEDARRPRGRESRVIASCNAVLARMDTILREGASARIRADFTPPRCTVNARAEAACKAQCAARLDPGYVKATCAPGHLYGRCDGTCTGTCDGRCSGRCDGATDAAGRCAGTCSGRCDGDCRGRCSVEFEEPRCDVEGRAPSADARCDGSCRAHADLTARCTEPTVDVEATVDVGEIGALIATLQQNLPPLLMAQLAYGKRIAGDVEVLVRTGAELPMAFGRLSAKAGACLAAAANATVAAEATIRITVEASASISARAGASARGG